MMKKILLVAVSVLLIVSLTGCAQAIGQKLAEKAIENATGNKVDISNNGDKVTIQGKDGQSVTVGDTKWPSSDLGKAVPQPAAGKVAGVVESNDGVMISMENFAKADYDTYLDQIKNTYSTDPTNFSSDDSASYSAKNGDGTISVGLVFSASDKTLLITVSKQQPESTASN